MRIANEDERRFYEIEAHKNNWGVRELQRQFDAALYARLTLSRDKEKVKALSEKGLIVLAEISLDLSQIEEGLMLTINEIKEHTLFLMDDATDHGEAVYQISEGCFYDYELSNADYFLADPFAISFSKISEYSIV